MCANLSDDIDASNKNNINDTRKKDYFYEYKYFNDVFMKRIQAALGTWSGRFGLLLLIVVWTCARGDETADRIERVRLLRELLETRPGPQSKADPSGIPGASIEVDPSRVREAGRRPQLEDSQWRNLLGSQQMQTYAPSTQMVPQSQWRSQTAGSERRAEDLSTDILRRSQEYLSNGHR